MNDEPKQNRILSIIGDVIAYVVVITIVSFFLAHYGPAISVCLGECS